MDRHSCVGERGTDADGPEQWLQLWGCLGTGPLGTAYLLLALQEGLRQFCFPPYSRSSILIHWGWLICPSWVNINEVGS